MAQHMARGIPHGTAHIRTEHNQHTTWRMARRTAHATAQDTQHGAHTQHRIPHNTAHSTAQHMAHSTTHGLVRHGMAWYSTQHTTHIIAHTLTVEAMSPPHCLYMCAWAKSGDSSHSAWRMA